VLTKSSLMLGLGETDDEVLQAMDDLRAANVDILALGQYLQPTANHLPVQRFVHPDTFASLREAGLARGFVEVAAGPLVRSSYRAERVLERNNLGLGLGLAHDPAASPAPAPAAAQRIPLQQL
jgi:lipoic acid synthetase